MSLSNKKSIRLLFLMLSQFRLIEQLVDVGDLQRFEDSKCVNVIFFEFEKNINFIFRIQLFCYKT